MKENDSHIYVIFGASGDLTKRKLVPALYSLFVQDLLPEKFALLGVSRSVFTDEAFRLAMKSAIKEFKEIEDTTKIDDFVAKIYYESIKFDDASSYVALNKRLEKLRLFIYQPRQVCMELYQHTWLLWV